MVLRKITQRGKPRRGHSLIFVSMAPRVLEIFRKATICADRENAPDRRECPDSISFPRHSDSEWFIENVTHNGKHPLGRNVFAGAWRRGDPTESQRSATERQGMTSIVPGSNSRPGPRPRE